MVANVTNDVATSFKKFSTITNEVATITKEVMVAVGKLTRWSRRPVANFFLAHAEA